MVGYIALVKFKRCLRLEIIAVAPAVYRIAAHILVVLLRIIKWHF